MKRRILLSGVFFLSVSMCSVGFSQAISTKNGTWKTIAESEIPESGTRYIKPTKFLTLKMDVAKVRQILAQAKRIDDPNYVPVFIELIKPDGTLGRYQVHENETMSLGLAAQFPEIRSYDGIAMDHSGEVVKFDLTPQGFHAMTLVPGGNTWFIDPYSFGGGDIENYVAYFKSDFSTDKTFECHLDELLPTELQSENEDIVKSFGNCMKRTYRLALAATGEYTVFHGGTVALAQAAQVTTMNRVNGIYMRDLAVTMTIIPNNNLIIYTSGSTDPYSNGNAGTMLGQNQNNLTTVIGGANYDIGHVFGTNSGGVAYLGSVCSSSNKARGVTGSGAPVNDPFDIDYVAHEMGHQFSGNHTFRGNVGACNGNGNGPTAMEPGSGSTVMAYAGICAPQNVQANSDDHFHGVNMDEMHLFLGAAGNGCAVSTPIPNQSSPTITGTVGNVTIPAGTPFALTATATDADGDVLSYCWEQMNNQNSTQPPVATSTGGPNFRSRTPSTSGTRYFPSIASLLTNGPFTWEVLPTVSRTMNFRCTVRDNEAEGGCNDYQDITVTTTASAGPFIVNYPSATGITWSGNTTETVTWTVANTNAAPVSCANVDILISLDAGVTFTVLANDVPNDGSQIVTVPNTATTNAIIMVICENGTFFDVSNNRFTITTGGAPCNNPTLPTLSGNTTICPGGNTTITVTAGTLNDATGWNWTSGSCGGTNVGTGNSMVLSAPGTYFVRGQGGCVTGGACQTITITQSPVNTSTTVNGITINATQGSAQYQWLNCNTGNSPIAGATAQSFTPTANGSYAVTVTTNGCSATSSCVNITNLGIDDLNFEDVSVYPNPSNGQVTVSFNKEVNLKSFVVRDITGRLIREEKPQTTNGITFDISAEAQGVYFLNIEVGGAIQSFKLIKN
ncbi:Ser-Thr-rich glycosyl-phosphatidyl-inositol-anchored membrane family protein [compost metagenome]